MKRWMILCLLLCFLPACAASAVSRGELSLIRAYEQGELIRLHILAEDDSPQAQALKLHVRDAVLKAFASSLQGDDADELYEQLQLHAEDMRQVAEAEARMRGFQGAVSVEVGWLELPAKQYGRVLLPAQRYRGLRITLGAGQGRNWWCVLFPSLCLASATDTPWRTEPSFEQASITADSTRILSLWTAYPPQQ